MKKLHLLCALLCLSALSGCLQKDAPSAGLYTITAIDGSAVDAGRPINVTYQEDRLAGDGPVNRWSVPVGTDGKLGVGISTRMAGAPEQMELEAKLLQALDGGTLKAGAHGKLEVVKDGKAAVTLKPVRPEPFGGGAGAQANRNE